MCNNLLQEPICRLAGVHLPGIDCLSDDQILPILLAMDDPKSLLNCGRASPRLYRLVCDPEVWRHLLKGIGFSKKQMEELVLFAKGLFGISGSPEMMPEVVKEAARRFPVSENVKLTIAIQSWGNPESFEVGGIFLETLTRVAEDVGAKFAITEVQDSATGFRFPGFMRLIEPIFKLIDGHVAQQEQMLTRLELKEVSLCDGFIKQRNFFFNLQRASQEWRVLDLIVYKRKDFETLARCSANGRIDTIHFRAHHRLPRARLQLVDDVKSVWRITNKFVFRLFDGSPDIEIGGGKGEGSRETEWQRILQVVFDNRTLAETYAKAEV